MAMELEAFTFSFLLIFLFFVSGAEGGVIGVAYGRVADNLPPPCKVVELLKANGVSAARIYDADGDVLRAFAGSGIKLAVTLPNDKLPAAADPNAAATWVCENIAKHYPATQINAIDVGNEVFNEQENLSSALLPAMWNIYNALKKLNLADKIKVTSPVAFSALEKSFPPSEGSFSGCLAPTIKKMLEFISQTDSYFSINLYPYLTYMENPQIDLKYALGLPNNGVRDPRTGLVYYSLFDAQVDALYSAMEALGHGCGASLAARRRGFTPVSPRPPRVRVPETGHPAIPPPPPHSAATEGSLSASLAVERGPTVENARAYNGNLIRRIVEGKTGTPRHPDYDLDVYIFSLFNENLKSGPETEKYYGLFYPNGTKVYDVSFRPGGESWCVANPAAGNQRLQKALKQACGHRGADCEAIQPGARCYEPNTVEAHASYAMNSYYQKHGRDASACDVHGAAQVVYSRPAFGNC